MYALIDCNNFYASCERLFRPDLRNKPIIVLSSNDGCVIARSNEAKTWINMGDPYFKIKLLCNQHHIHVFSSNFALYGDLSHRIMSLIKQSWTNVEVYSIDEAFLDLREMSPSLYESFCLTLQKRILKATGIPTSIGIGRTKTLAKAANHLCKKILKISVFNLEQAPRWLEKMSVGEVWGIGRQWHKTLLGYGIYTAHDLATTSIPLLKNHYNNSALIRTAMELQGISCIRFEDNTPSKRILSSRSFGNMQTEYDILAQAISSHCAIVYQKLRRQQLYTQRLTVFVRINSFRHDLNQYCHNMTSQWVTPTDDIRFLTKMAKDCLKKLYKPGFQYKKVGICLESLSNKHHQQLDLFEKLSDDSQQNKDQLLAVFDKINHKFGRHTIKLGAEGYHKPWAANSAMRSPCYTTRWSDLRVVTT